MDVQELKLPGTCLGQELHPAPHIFQCFRLMHEILSETTPSPTSSGHGVIYEVIKSLSLHKIKSLLASLVDNFNNTPLSIQTQQTQCQFMYSTDYQQTNIFVQTTLED